MKSILLSLTLFVYFGTSVAQSEVKKIASLHELEYSHDIVKEGSWLITADNYVISGGKRNSEVILFDNQGNKKHSLVVSLVVNTIHTLGKGKFMALGKLSTWPNLGTATEFEIKNEKLVLVKEHFFPISVFPTTMAGYVNGFPAFGTTRSIDPKNDYKGLVDKGPVYPGIFMLKGTSLSKSDIAFLKKELGESNSAREKYVETTKKTKIQFLPQAVRFPSQAENLGTELVLLENAEMGFGDENIVTMNLIKNHSEKLFEKVGISISKFLLVGSSIVLSNPEQAQVSYYNLKSKTHITSWGLTFPPGDLLQVGGCLIAASREKLKVAVIKNFQNSSASVVERDFTAQEPNAFAASAMQRINEDTLLIKSAAPKRIIDPPNPDRNGLYLVTLEDLKGC